MCPNGSASHVSSHRRCWGHMEAYYSFAAIGDAGDIQTSLPDFAGPSLGSGGWEKSRLGECV